MNKFDERYEIRLAKLADISMIMEFIDRHWRKGHIMAVDRELFEYEYVNKDKVNFVLAIDKISHSLEGIFGFINCSYSNINKRHIWGSMWKVLDGNMPLLGIELAKRVINLSHCQLQIGNGANPNTTIPLRKIFFKEKTGKMKHFYLLNKKIKEYKIAVIHDEKETTSKIQRMNKNIIRFTSIDQLKEEFDLKHNNSYIPFKDYEYINKRYFNHPYYKYDIYGVKNDGNVEALLVLREVQANGSKVLRIMDYIGNHELFKYLNDFFMNKLEENDYEYVDFYVLGFRENLILEAGFIRRTENDTNIIPNYFEPFLQENVEIWVHYKDANTTFFKADGDQDRPNEPNKSNKLKNKKV